MIGPALPAVELGGVVVPLWSASSFEQHYTTIGPRPVMRMLNGAGVLQAHWQKLQTTLSGAGWLPSGFDGLDRTAQHMLKCAVARAIFGAGNAITIPAARRSDYVPGMMAMMADRRLIETPSSLAGNVLTGTVVAGAIGYQAWYWPQLTVFIASLTTGAQQGEQGGWQIVCEEI